MKMSILDWAWALSHERRHQLQESPTIPNQNVVNAFAARTIRPRAVTSPIFRIRGSWVCAGRAMPA